jgi:hypothetical protein
LVSSVHTSDIDLALSKHGPTYWFLSDKRKLYQPVRSTSILFGRENPMGLAEWELAFLVAFSGSDDTFKVLVMKECGSVEQKKMIILTNFFSPQSPLAGSTGSY